MPAGAAGRRGGGVRLALLAAAGLRRAGGLSCWSTEVRREDCCPEPPLREGCWDPAAGLTREACCQEEPEPGSEAQRRREQNNARLVDAALRAAAALAGAAAPPAAAGLGGAGPAEVLGHLWDALPAGSVRAQLEEWAGLAATRAGARKSAGGAQLLELRLLEGLLVRLADSHRDFGATVGRSLQLSRLLWAGVHSRSRAAWAREAREARGRPPLDASMEPVHIAMVASVGKPVFGRKALIGVRSALFFARSRPLRFHLLVDEEGEEDMRRALGTLEPWLRSRGQFRLYRAEAQEHVWRRVRAMFPADCLNFKAREGSHHYGSPGFLRLFPHEIVREPGARVVVWVDAGDFAFMSDPADLLVHHSAFGPEQMVAAPVLRELPFQIFDLPRLRRANWTQMVAVAAAEGYAERGPDLCFYGEGRLFNLLARGRHAKHWHYLPSGWTFEPWQEWQPFFGLVDLWSRRGLGQEEVWLRRAFPGLRDFADVRVACPDWQEVFFFNSFFGKTADADLEAAALIAKHYHEMLATNSSFTDWKGQELRCGERIRGVHLTLPFHNIPFAHHFLNFWAGAPVWDKDWLRGRDLRK